MKLIALSVMRCSLRILIIVSKPWMKQAKTAVIDDSDEKRLKHATKVTGSVSEVMKSCPIINQTPGAHEKATGHRTPSSRRISPIRII